MINGVENVAGHLRGCEGGPAATRHASLAINPATTPVCHNGPHTLTYFGSDTLGHFTLENRQPNIIMYGSFPNLSPCLLEFSAVTKKGFPLI